MEKKYIKVFLIGILLILIVGTIRIAKAQEETTINIDKSFNLKTWFQKTFGIQTYSIVGDYRQCDRYPGRTIQVAWQGTIPKASTYYTNSLTDVFDKKWNTIGEWKNSPNLICGDSDGCIAEYYSCPHPECTSDSQCSSWYGSGSECNTKVANDPNIAYQSGNTFNYCTEPSQVEVTCYYYTGSGSSCSTRTYIGDTTCPSTYNGRTLYSTRNACENQIPVCSAGQTKCEGTNQDIYITCSNGQWASNGQVNGQCGYTSETTPTCSDGIQNQGETGIDCGGPCSVCGIGGTTFGDIRLDGAVEVTGIVLVTVQNPSSQIKTFKIPLKNFGTGTETINVEAGFYSAGYARNTAKLYSILPFFSAVTIPQCNPGEDFVKATQVTLARGESEVVEINVNPYSSFVTYGPGEHNLATDPPIWFVGLYQYCRGTPGVDPIKYGYINNASTTGKGVMFDYGNYELSCPSSVQFGNLEGLDILCDGQKYGTCEINSFIGTGKKTFTLDAGKTCDITSTIAIVNGSAQPGATLTSTTLFGAKKLALTKDEISKATSPVLLASSCLYPSECILPAADEKEFSASCTSIAKLRDEGTLTEVDEDNFFSNVKPITQVGALSSAAGITACLIAGAATAAAPAAFPITAPLLVGCGLAGGLFGGTVTSIILDISQDDNLLKELKAENANAVGICVKESKSGLDSFFKWAAWFDVTGDGNKDGTDGLIIFGVLAFLFVLIIGRR